jgi:Histidine kinase/Y_Y_Y domain
MRHFVLVLFILLMLCLSLAGQNFIAKKYNTNTGLLSINNTKTIQDSNYYYYTCSFGGLQRYDGSQFKSFKNLDGLRNYRVTDICEIRRNQLLVCNYFTLLRFDGRSFMAIQTGLHPTVIYKKVIALSGNRHVVVTNVGPFLLKNDDKLTPFVMNGYKGIEFLKENKNGGTVIYDRYTHSINIFSKNGDVQSYQMPVKTSIIDLYMFNNTVFAKTTEGVVELYNGEINPFIPEGTLEMGIKVMDCYMDKKHRLWILDQAGTLWIKNQQNWQNLSKQFALTKIVKPHFMEDANDNIVLTSLIGIVVFRESQIYKIPIEETHNNEVVYNISTYSKDTVCVGINRFGLVLLANKRKFIKNIANVHLLASSDDIEECNYFDHGDEDIVYIRKKGLYTIKDNKLLPYCIVKGNLAYLNRGIYDTKRDCYYAGNENMVLRIHRDRIDTLRFDHIAPGLRAHTFLLLDNGQVLFTATHKYLIRITANTIEDITEQLNINQKDFAVTKHGDRLWVSVLGEALREYKYAQDTLTLTRHIAKENGLIDVNIGNIVFDDNHNLWLNCFSGLYVLKTEHSGNQIYSKKINLTQSDDHVPLIEGIYTQDGHIFAPSTNHIYEIAVDEALKEPKPYSTYFSEIRVNGVPLQSLVDTKKITLKDGTYYFPPTFTSFLFHCNTVYHGLDDAIRYQYRLSGLDQKWQDLYETDILNFNNLQSGSYILEVKSTYDLHNRFSTSATFTFKIYPPYYKTWWFRTLVSTMAIGLIFGYIKRREMIKEKENMMSLQISEWKLTALQSQMNPHFIFNSLNSIQNFIMQHKPLEAAKYLSKFSKLVRRILNQSFSHLTSMQEIVETLKMYMELESFRFSNEFVWEIVMDDEEEIADISLPPLLLQPYVENAIIHGLMPKEGPKCLIIKIYVNAEVLHCIIDDNGVGRQLKTGKEEHISRGGKLTADMVMTMKTLLNTDAKIIITDKKDVEGKPLGTTIDIAIPLKHSFSSK